MMIHYNGSKNEIRRGLLNMLIADSRRKLDTITNKELKESMLQFLNTIELYALKKIEFKDLPKNYQNILIEDYGFDKEEEIREENREVLNDDEINLLLKSIKEEG